MCKFKNRVSLAWKTWMDQIPWRVFYYRTRSAINAFKQSQKSGLQINLGFCVSASNDRLESVTLHLVFGEAADNNSWLSSSTKMVFFVQNQPPHQIFKGREVAWTLKNELRKQQSDFLIFRALEINTVSKWESLGTDWTSFTFFSAAWQNKGAKNTHVPTHWHSLQELSC